MNRNKGYQKEELNEPTLMSFYLEYHDRSMLREDALKRKMTMGQIIRHLIKGFLSHKDKKG